MPDTERHKGAGWPQGESPLDVVRKQRSHVLFVLSNSQSEQPTSFLNWYQGVYRRTLLQSAGVLAGRHYERHAFDISLGAFPPLPFHYLGIYDLAIDDTHAAEALIDTIAGLHRDSGVAQAPATWLYYPGSEKVGRSPAKLPAHITLVFANAIDGQEADFREWYATRHIREALLIPTFVSGQCFYRSLFQKPGALDASFSMIASYEIEGTPQSIVDQAASLPAGALHFPSLHTQRFCKWVYKPLPDTPAMEH